MEAGKEEAGGLKNDEVELWERTDCHWEQLVKEAIS